MGETAKRKGREKQTVGWTMILHKRESERDSDKRSDGSRENILHEKWWERLREITTKETNCWVH